MMVRWGERCIILILGKCGEMWSVIDDLEERRGGEGWTCPGLAGPVYPALLLATLSDQDKEWPHHQPGLPPPPPPTAQPSFHSCFQNENWKCRAESHPRSRHCIVDCEICHWQQRDLNVSLISSVCPSAFNKLKLIRKCGSLLFQWWPWASTILALIKLSFRI